MKLRVSLVLLLFSLAWSEPHQVECLSHREIATGVWIEHLKDKDEHLIQRRFLPSQQQKNPEVVSSFGTPTPPSSSLLLHCFGPPISPTSKVPVVIVPGAKVDAFFYQTLAHSLRAQGFMVFALTFAHNQDDNYLQAQQLANAVARVRLLTKAAQVDLLAHSKGCIVATVYATPSFRQPWMSDYPGDVRRLLLVGGPNGGIDYFHRHPFEDRGASNWPMVWSNLLVDGKSVDCAAWQMDLEGYWPGQAQLVARWDERFPVQDRVSYYGGCHDRFTAEGIEQAIEAGGNFMARLSSSPLAEGVEVGLLAGNVTDVPGFRNETDGPSDGIILLDSALKPPYQCHLSKATVLSCNHIQLIQGAAAQSQIARFLLR